VVFSVIFVIVSCAAFYQYGIPSIANRTAYLIPESHEVSMGERVLEEFSGNNYFNESEIEEDSQARLREYLRQFSPPEISTSILFRGSILLAPNAFALPVGTIVITDELVALADYDEEIPAIYLHEVGHIKHKHLLTQGLKRSLLTLLIMAVTGDATVATDLVSLLPTILLSLNYSREFEIESDQYALEQLKQSNVDAVFFTNVMRKLMGTTEKADSLFLSADYLSTHPAPDERLNYLGNQAPLPEVEESIVLFRYENVARFDGQWHVSISPDDEESSSMCGVSKETVSISDGELIGERNENSVYEYSHEGTVDSKGVIFWQSELDTLTYLEFSGSLNEAAAGGQWETQGLPGDSQKGRSGTWTMSRVKEDLASTESREP
jgi:Zn-dependent protease with chaperone function